MRDFKFTCRSDLIYQYKKLLSESNNIITTTCEVGVWTAIYSCDIVSRLKDTIQKHYMVDAWAPIDNYNDDCNKSLEEFENIFKRAKDKMNSIDIESDKLIYLRGLSQEMADQIPDESLDFCYIDARHDYLGCKLDIESYWRKLKPGRMMAGHDYLTAEECSVLLKKLGHNLPDQKWEVCCDGSINHSAVKGAVNEFAKKHDLNVFVSTKDNWPTWAFFKP